MRKTIQKAKFTLESLIFPKNIYSMEVMETVEWEEEGYGEEGGPTTSLGVPCPDASWATS